MADTVVEMPPERPNLAERIMLLSIEQSRANWQGQSEKAKELGERMIREVALAAGIVPAEPAQVE